MWQEVKLHSDKSVRPVEDGAQLIHKQSLSYSSSTVYHSICIVFMYPYLDIKDRRDKTIILTEPERHWLHANC